MSGTYKVSNKCIELIKSFEGLRLCAYKDLTGIPTIGFGTTKDVRMGMTVTKEQAECLLAADVQRFVDHIAALVTVPLSQNQIDALVAFVYNIGPAAFAKSTMLKLINQGLIEDAANQFLRWNRAGGQVLAGLTRRRIAERELFLRAVK